MLLMSYCVQRLAITLFFLFHYFQSYITKIVLQKISVFPFNIC